MQIRLALASLLRGEPPAATAVLADGADPGAAATLDSAIAAVLAQNGWNHLWSGLFAVIVALRWNWRSSRLGYGRRRAAPVSHSAGIQPA